jgi:PiT family inorganic phosphate transporter
MDVVVLAVVVIAIALVFDFTNGFHDAANAIATSVSTRALTPRRALLLAAVMNLVGAMLGTGVAETIGSGIITPPAGVPGVTIVLAALGAAIAWNVLTWYLGLPTSSSHALIGGLTGAGLVSATTQVHADVLVDRVAIPLVVAPAVGFVVAYALMIGLLWAARRARPGPLFRRFRMAQSISAAAMALGHGLQDAQKTMGAIVIVLVAAGLHEGDAVPLWVKIAAAVAISLGTYAGGWRIIRTLGQRVIELDPPRGFVAETVAAGVLYTTAVAFGAPVSTTQTITSTIMGVGATRRMSAIRWGVATTIGYAWLLTLPVTGLLAAGLYLALRPVLG